MQTEYLFLKKNIPWSWSQFAAKLQTEPTDDWAFLHLVTSLQWQDKILFKLLLLLSYRPFPGRLRIAVSRTVRLEPLISIVAYQLLNTRSQDTVFVLSTFKLGLLSGFLLFHFLLTPILSNEGLLWESLTSYAVWQSGLQWHARFWKLSLQGAVSLALTPACWAQQL